MMTKALSCLAFLLMSTGAFAGSFGELQGAVPGTLQERIPVFEASKAAPADTKQYNFRCLAGPQTPQYVSQNCYLYTSRGQQACVNAGCSWGFGGTPMPDYSFTCMAASYTPQYIAYTCHLYKAKGQQACVNAGCAWGMGSNPLPAFHCAAGSFTPQYIASTCYLYTGRGQQPCVNAGCSWTYGARSSSKKPYNQWQMALHKIHTNEMQDDTLIAKVAKEPAIDTIVKELTEGGFKVQAMGDNSGGYLVSADVTGMDAGSEAVGLSKYYYVTEVLVSRRVYNSIFTVPD